jgi:hypothetical protein
VLPPSARDRPTTEREVARVAAATSLGRLLQQQGKRDEARRHVEEVYCWFTEGFDTADLKDARALLESLASA